MKQLLLGKNTEEISQDLNNLNEPAYKGKQISKWIYQRYVRDFEKMTDLSKDLRKNLQAS